MFILTLDVPPMHEKLEKKKLLYLKIWQLQLTKSQKDGAQDD